MNTLRGLSLGLLSALALAGGLEQIRTFQTAAHAADAAPPSPAQSCGPNCRFQAIALPGGVFELVGAYDCGSATCWNGDAVKLHWNVGAASCISATATPYNPSDTGGEFHSAQVASRLEADGASFSAAGFQITSATGLEGLFFTVVCRK